MTLTDPSYEGELLPAEKSDTEKALDQDNFISILIGLASIAGLAILSVLTGLIKMLGFIWEGMAHLPSMKLLHMYLNLN